MPAANQKPGPSGSQICLVDQSDAEPVALGIANDGFTVEDLDITSPPPMPPLRPVVVVEEAPRTERVDSQISASSGEAIVQQAGRLVVPVEVNKVLSDGLPEIEAASPSFRSKQSDRVDSQLNSSSNSLNAAAAATAPASSRSVSSLSENVSERLRILRRRFETRANSLRESTIQPLSESESDNESTVTDPKSGDEKEEKRKQIEDLIAAPDSALDKEENKGKLIELFGKCSIRLPHLHCSSTIDPQGHTYMLWLSLVSTALVYNCLAVPLRSTFTIYDPPGSSARIAWLCCDYVADLIYAFDILVKTRVHFMSHGIIEKNPKECLKNYLAKVDFRLDLAALLPLDFLYFAIGIVPIVRFPRILKFKAFWEVFDRLDKMVTNSHIIRIVRTVSYMVFLIHLEACFYYQVSKWQGFGINGWVFNDKWDVTAYIYCFYLATKTATSIGNNPKPTNYIEQLFMTAYWLSGVFVFALLIGQIRDIFQAANANKTNYRKTMDITTWYMKSLNVPEYMLDKVRTWFNYNWEQQKTLNENSLLEGLPRKLMTDLAIHVHYGILSKVSLFQDCDRTLLSDLILKLKPVLYLPTDYICRKGEVGSEMYIIMNGQVEVVGGPNNSIVFVTLKEGSVFGEISLMALSGGNRRTADVRSKGFSTLFTLSKVDFEEAMRDYPQAYTQLRKRAKKTLTKSKVAKVEKKKPEVEEIIKEREPTPKLLHTVIKAVSKERPTSALTKFIKPQNVATNSVKQRRKKSSVKKPTEQTSQVKLQPLQAAQAQSIDQIKETKHVGQAHIHSQTGQAQSEQSLIGQGHALKNVAEADSDLHEDGTSARGPSAPAEERENEEACDSDCVSAMSEESIDLPEMIGIDPEFDIKTPPPTSEDTPAVLLQKLNLYMNAEHKPKLDRAEILDETQPKQANAAGIKSKSSSNEEKQPQKPILPQPRAAASPLFLHKKNDSHPKDALSDERKNLGASSQTPMQNSKSSTIKQQAIESSDSNQPALGMQRPNGKLETVRKDQKPQSQSSNASKESSSGRLQTKPKSMPMKQLHSQSHSKTEPAKKSATRSQSKQGRVSGGTEKPGANQQPMAAVHLKSKTINRCVQKGVAEANQPDDEEELTQKNRAKKPKTGPTLPKVD